MSSHLRAWWSLPRPRYGALRAARTLPHTDGGNHLPAPLPVVLTVIYCGSGYRVDRLLECPPPLLMGPCVRPLLCLHEPGCCLSSSDAGQNSEEGPTIRINCRITNPAIQRASEPTGRVQQGPRIVQLTSNSPMLIMPVRPVMEHYYDRGPQRFPSVYFLVCTMASLADRSSAPAAAW